MVAIVGWRDRLDKRQCAEVEFCKLYANKFNHGTDGHNIRLLVALLADLLDEKERSVTKVSFGAVTAADGTTYVQQKMDI